MNHKGHKVYNTKNTMSNNFFATFVYYFVFLCGKNNRS